MRRLYNKKHVQISVSAATALGMLYGFWIGKRADVAGLLESFVVLLAFIVSAAVVFSQIDASYLAETQDDDH